MMHTQLALDMCTDFYFKIVKLYPFEELRSEERRVERVWGIV